MQSYMGCTGLPRKNPGAPSLKHLYIPGSVTSIGANLFEENGLVNMDIPNSLTEISHSMFLGCKDLESVTIPSSITSIGPSAFYGCSNLTKITSMLVDPMPLSYKDEVWNGINFNEAILYVPFGTKEKYETTSGWTLFKNIVESYFATNLSSSIVNDKSVNGKCFDLSGRRLMILPAKGVYIEDGRKVMR